MLKVSFDNNEVNYTKPTVLFNSLNCICKSCDIYIINFDHWTTASGNQTKYVVCIRNRCSYSQLFSTGLNILELAR